LVRRHTNEAWRARLILLLDSGHTWAAIRDKLDCTDSFIDRWSKRFLEERLAGLFSRHAGQLPTTLTAAMEARILESNASRPMGPRTGARASSRHSG
jgi:transposase